MNDNQVPGGCPVGPAGKVLLVLGSLALLAGFALAVWLEPDARGFGTHQRLGLPPCTFMSMFQIPCPSCGMTTSFALFVRGRLFEAARANAAGLLLAMVCAALVPWCWISLRRGRLWLVDQPDRAFVCLLILVCGAALLQWAVRLFLP